VHAATVTLQHARRDPTITTDTTASRGGSGMQPDQSARTQRIGNVVIVAAAALVVGIAGRVAIGPAVPGKAEAQLAGERADLSALRAALDEAVLKP
jgi:hypothetical protein